jgi:hypothetical protein
VSAVLALKAGLFAIAAKIGTDADGALEEAEGLLRLVLGNVDAGRDPVLDRLEDAAEAVLGGDVVGLHGADELLAVSVGRDVDVVLAQPAADAGVRPGQVAVRLGSPVVVLLEQAEDLLHVHTRS